jgi:hypothetical protein
VTLRERLQDEERGVGHVYMYIYIAYYGNPREKFHLHRCDVVRADLTGLS